MDLNIDQIDTSKLELSSNYYGTIEFIKDRLDNQEMVSDEILSWIINPPPIYAAIETDELKKAQRRHSEYYYAEKDKSLKTVQLLKKEFYDFMCTESKYYQKERASIGGNINNVITGVAASIATNIGSVEIGIITSFVTTFMIVIGKMGKKVMCESFKPKEK